VLLPDSGHLQEEEARFAHEAGYSRHDPPVPLYTREDAERALERLRPVPLAAEHGLPGSMSFALSGAGHLLGATSVALRGEGRTVVFSGDLGRPGDATLPPPEPPPAGDVLVVESTYGDRLHPEVDPAAELEAVIVRTVARGGSVLIPAFAVGRAQLLMLLLHRLAQAGRIPRLPVFLDSPMAVEATRIFLRHPEAHRLSREEADAVVSSAEMVRTQQESRRVGRMSYPRIVISASGMATGGRVLHHLKTFAPEPRNTILLSGFQAAGTRGAQLAAGAGTVKIHGGYVPVRAEVAQLHAASGHADASELVEWMRRMPAAPGQVYVTHGEPAASDALRLRIQEELGWRARAPEHRERVRIGERAEAEPMPPIAAG
jgi:metallo-beta-lactamase family protein